MNAEFVDSVHFDIIVTAEDGDILPESNAFRGLYVVARMFDALGNSIDFEIFQYMDENGYLYGFGEELYFGNDYAVYPFLTDGIDSFILYYVTPENIKELIDTGKTIIEPC